MFRTQISPGFPHPLKTDSNEFTGIGKNKNREMMKPGFKKKLILTTITGCIFHTVQKRLNVPIENLG